MKFAELAKYLERLEKTSSRIEITKILAELFKKSDSNEIDKIVYLLLGSLAPSYKNIVFNIAERMMLKAIAKAYQKDIENVRDLYKKMGDLGNIAEELSKSKGKSKFEEFSVGVIYQKLMAVAQDEGEGSQERKIEQMAEILFKLDPLSVRFIARIPVGKLRLGFSDKTILDALSWMEVGDKSAKGQLEYVYQVLPDIGLLAKEVKDKGIKEATVHAKPVVGVPVSPMLAQRLKDPREMIKKMERVGVEPKLDGLRISIHFKRGKFVKAFTRNMNEVSWMFP